MFFKQICIVFIILGILGYIYGDYIFYKQAEFMLAQQYPIPAYEAYERIIKYYPKSKYAKIAKEQMAKLRTKNSDLDNVMNKNEKELAKKQKQQEKVESFR